MTELEKLQQRDQDEDMDAPKFKRKKTVTWADGEALTEDGDDVEGSDIDVQYHADQSNGDDGGPLATSRNNASDTLYRHLDETALQRQEPVPKTEHENEPLTKQQLLQRRVQNIENLMHLYEAEYWALAEELQLKHQQFKTQHPDKTALKGEGSSGGVQNIKEQLTAKKITSLSSLQAVWQEMKETTQPPKTPTTTTATTAAVEATTSSTNGLVLQGDVVPSYTDIEKIVLALPPPDEMSQIDTRSRLLAQKHEFVQRLNLLGRMEAGALAAIGRELENKNAIAVLCGDVNVYYMLKPAVSLGRLGDVKPVSTGGGTDQQQQQQASPSNTVKIDIDISKDLPPTAAQTVSKQQAQIYLDADGVFRLRNVGRRVVAVNNDVLETGYVAELPNMSIITVSGLSLLFIHNQAAVDRALARSAAVAV